MEKIQAFLTKNPYSRTGMKRPRTRALVAHWVANPGTSAMFNRDYFESLKHGFPDASADKTYASTQYIIGIDGEVIQCMPEDEIAYHCGSMSYTPEAKELFRGYCTHPDSPNLATIGVEWCHPDWSGEFTLETLESAVELYAEMVYRHLIPTEHIVTHHWIVGWKNCPRWFVEHPEEFDDFRVEVAKAARELSRGNKLEVPI